MARTGGMSFLDRYLTLSIFLAMGLAVLFLRVRPEYMLALILIGLVHVALWRQRRWWRQGAAA